MVRGSEKDKVQRSHPGPAVSAAGCPSTDILPHPARRRGMRTAMRSARLPASIVPSSSPKPSASAPIRVALFRIWPRAHRARSLECVPVRRTGSGLDAGKAIGAHRHSYAGAVEPCDGWRAGAGPAVAPGTGDDRRPVRFTAQFVVGQLHSVNQEHTPMQQTASRDVLHRTAGGRGPLWFHAPSPSRAPDGAAPMAQESTSSGTLPRCTLDAWRAGGARDRAKRAGDDGIRRVRRQWPARNGPCTNAQSRRRRRRARRDLACLKPSSS